MMKICPNCQFECTDQDRFCAKCGMPFAQVKAEEPAPAAEPAAEETPAAQEIPTFVKPDAEPKAEIPQAPTYQAPPRYMPPEMKGEEPVSTGKWILYHLIPMIPFVGWLVYIVMLFVWAFGNNENTTFRNWARSQLIISGISLVIGVLVIVLIAALGLTGAMAFGDALENGSFYYEYGY